MSFEAYEMMYKRKQNQSYVLTKLSSTQLKQLCSFCLSFNYTYYVISHLNSFYLLWDVPPSVAT